MYCRECVGMPFRLGKNTGKIQKASRSVSLVAQLPAAKELFKKYGAVLFKDGEAKDDE